MKKIILMALLVLMITSLPAYARDNIDGFDIPVDIKINGINLKTPVNSFLEDGTVYVPVRALCEALGATVAWDEMAQSATVTKGDVALRFSETDPSMHKAQLYHDSFCTPVRIIAESFGFKVDWDNKYYNVLITMDGYEVPAAYINHNAYSDEDVLLLAKLIYAEAGACTFNEQLGIGEVVMNRIASPSYPSTVSGVIYDTKWSVQFPPAFDGSLDREPSGIALIAAKCVMHGTNVVGGSIGFTYTGDTTSWITQNLKLCVAFESISFYQ